MKRMVWPLLVCSVLLGPFISVASAQPASNRAIDDVYAERAGNCSVVTIEFVFPVQYLSHFPEERGKELQVQLRPLAVGDTNVPALIFNEPVRVQDGLSIELSRFDYMGNGYRSDPYLLLNSPNEFSFRVQQGEDFRSLVLFVTPGHISDCD